MRGEGVAAERQLELGRKRVGEAARVLRERGAHELAQPRGRDLLARRIHRGVVRRPARLADVVALHVESVAPELAAQPHARSRHQLLGEPRLVEERRVDLAAARITNDRSDERPSAPQGPRACADYSTLDRDFTLGAAELRDRNLVDRALVTTRSVEEQVAHRLDAERAQPLGERCADTRQRQHIECVEPLWRRPAARPGPLVLDHACETRVHSGHCRHLDAA